MVWSGSDAAPFFIGNPLIIFRESPLDVSGKVHKFAA